MKRALAVCAFLSYFFPLHGRGYSSAWKLEQVRHFNPQQFAALPKWPSPKRKTYMAVLDKLFEVADHNAHEVLSAFYRLSNEVQDDRITRAANKLPQELEDLKERYSNVPDKELSACAMRDRKFLLALTSIDPAVGYFVALRGLTDREGPKLSAWSRIAVAVAKAFKKIRRLGLRKNSVAPRGGF